MPSDTAIKAKAFRDYLNSLILNPQDLLSFRFEDLDGHIVECELTATSDIQLVLDPEKNTLRITVTEEG